MAHAGVGSVSYIGCLLLNHAIGIKPTLVPFTGTAPAMNAMLAGQVDYDLRPGARPAAACARRHAKAMAIATKKRHPLLPDVPTSAEQGCRSSTCRAVLCGVRAQGHAAGRSSTSSPTRSTRASTSRPSASGWIDLGADIAEQEPIAARRRWRALVKSEIARLTPILKAAAAK